MGKIQKIMGNYGFGFLFPVPFFNWRQPQIQKTMDNCGFGILLAKNVPHILEKIFFNLDYASYKACMEVSNVWFELLTSESFKELGKTHYYKEIVDELWSAILENHVNKVRRIISITNIDVNFRKLKRVSHTTPLWIASISGFSDVVNLLLQAGADANQVYDGSSRSLLHGVVGKGSKIVAQLLAGGADINKQDTNGETPLHEACRRNKPKVVKLLLDKGAEPNLRDQYGRTPLHFAAEYGSATMVKYLLAGGAEINIRNEYGITPLGYALDRRHTSNVNNLYTGGMGLGVGVVVRLLKHFGGTR